MSQIFNIRNIYVKGLEYNTGNLPEDILKGVEIQANMNVNVGYSLAGDNLYEVFVNCVLESTNGENNTPVYTFKISQAGIFHVEGFEGEEKEQVLKIHGPSILFPYLRERIYNFTGFSGIGNGMIIPTVNFTDIYEMDKNQPKDEIIDNKEEE